MRALGASLSASEKERGCGLGSCSAASVETDVEAGIAKLPPKSLFDSTKTGWSGDECSSLSWG